jgi:DNA invertase Pin-like site-specific DNA recombinase
MTMPAVHYAAKSTEDKHGSIPTQLEDCRQLAARQGWRTVGEFSDEAFSAYSANRGPGLDQAKELAAATAAERGLCILVAQDADRFARGAGDAPGAAEHLGEIYFQMKRQGVELWTVRSGHLDLLRAALEGERANDESARKSQAVKAGKRRQAERGEHLGGPLPLGYCSTGVGAGILGLYDEECITVERIFELAAEGVPDSAIARTVNSEGHRTRAGRPFDRRAIQAIVCNVFYSGRIAYDDRLYEGKHKALVQPEVFDRVRAQRPKRDHAPGHHTKGQPARRHLLSRLAVCGECQSPMYTYTSPYRRKDGTRARQYQCRAYRFADGTCSAKPVDAEAVDTAVMERLHDLLPDFESWLATLENHHDRERRRLEDEVDRAREKRHQAFRAVVDHEQNYRRLVTAGDAERADLALDFVKEARGRLKGADAAVEGAQARLDKVPFQPGPLLDFAIDLREAIRGKTEGARTVEQVNRALVELFEAFVIGDEVELHPDADPGLAAPGVTIEPELRWEVARTLFEASGWWEGESSWSPPPAPPMEWLEAVRYSGNSQGQA